MWPQSAGLILNYGFITWWRHQMEPFSASLALCAGNSPVSGEFPAQRPVTRSFDVFFDVRVNKRLSKQSWGWWFEMLSRSLWRHRTQEMRKYRNAGYSPVVLISFRIAPLASEHSYRWLSARLQYLQCVSNGDSAVLYQAIDMIPPMSPSNPEGCD